jgi:dTDP-glucose 4,6-dehydratase
MKLLVTGGCGFIGNNFIRYWLKKYPKDKIVNLDKLTYAGHLSSTKDFSKNKNYEFVKGDICNEKTTDTLTKGIDVVVHFAAESHVDRSIKDPINFLKTNVIGTANLLNSALKNKVKRFHHVSTDEVFGSLELKSNKKFDSKSPYAPRSPYAASKASSDHLARAYYHTYGLPITITNCANNFGPYQDPEKFLPRFITNLIEDKPIPVYGDGKNVRDWLYVEDHVIAIEKIIMKGKIGETYLIGGQIDEISNLEIAKLLLKMFNKNKSYIKFVEDRLGHDRRYAINWNKIKNELQWKPKYEFEKYLEETVRWYKENKWWWKPLKEKSENFYKNV